MSEYEDTGRGGQQRRQSPSYDEQRRDGQNGAAAIPPPPWLNDPQLQQYPVSNGQGPSRGRGGYAGGQGRGRQGADFYEQSARSPAAEYIADVP